MPNVASGKGRAQCRSTSRIALGKMRKFSYIFYILSEIEIVHQPKREVTCQMLNAHVWCHVFKWLEEKNPKLWGQNDRVGSTGFAIYSSGTLDMWLKLAKPQFFTLNGNYCIYLTRLLWGMLEINFSTAPYTIQWV